MSVDKTRCEPLILAIIVQFNHEDLTIDCIDGLRAQTVPPDVMIVDNGSDPRAVDVIDQYLELPNERIIETGGPLGFAEAVNLGIRCAQGEGYQYVFLAGNDTIAEPSVLEDLFAIAESDPTIGIVGPLQVFASKPSIVFSAGVRMNRRAWSVEHVGWNKAREDLLQTRPVLSNVDSLDFAAVLIPLRVIEKVGLLDDRYRFYWEDLDWCLRAQRKGYRCVVEISSAARHHVSATANEQAGRKEYFLTRNRFESAARFRSSAFVVKMVVGFLIAALSGQIESSGVMWQAVGDWMFRRRYRY